VFTGIGRCGVVVALYPFDELVVDGGEVVLVAFAGVLALTQEYGGTATIEESGQRRLEGREAFLEVRMAEDGHASVFATTS